MQTASSLRSQTLKLEATKKKALGIIILLFMCMAAFSAIARDNKTVGNPEVSALISVYSQPSLDSEVLGQYYPGAEAQFIGSENGWSGVLVGKDRGTRAGYVQDKYLMDGWLGRTDGIYPVQYDEVLCKTATSVSIHIWPDESAPNQLLPRVKTSTAPSYAASVNVVSGAI